VSCFPTYHSAVDIFLDQLTRNHPGLLKAGAPSIGTDPHDSHIWYYNGTPAAQVLVALDYILPTFASFHTPDIVLSGPDFGWNTGPFQYIMSGTLDASFAAIERGIPAIAFSSGNAVPVPYTWINASTKVGLQDPATITARLVSSLVQAFISRAAGSPILPKGYGVSVNLPYITSDTSDACTNPPFVLARMAVPVTNSRVKYNTNTGLFNVATAGGNQCVAGNCGLPGERDVLRSTCMSSVTVFALEYDGLFHGECVNVTDVTALVPVVVQVNGSRPLVGGLGANASVIGNGSHTPTPSVVVFVPPTFTAITSMGLKAHWSSSVLILGMGVAAIIL
jgi:5'-nucleotidase